MSKLLSRVGLAMIVLSTLLVSPSVVLADPDTTNCLYPTPADRFGVTVYADQQIGDFDVTPLAAARYLNWRADLAPERPNAMGYYFVVRISEGGHQPGANDLKTIASANPGSTWVMGNEAWGLPSEELAACDRVVSVPMWGRAESLNLSTAAAVISSFK